MKSTETFMAKHFSIRKVVLLGSGNVAWHLARALYRAGLDIVQVCSPHRSHAESLAQKVHAKAETECSAVEAGADLYLLAVPDDKIREAAGQLPPTAGIVCHTSGMTPMDALSRFENYGVFYPLQTFSKKKAVEMQQVPFCLEAVTPEVYAALQTVAAKLSRQVYPVSTENRMKLHLAAVLVNNFTNHLFAEAEAFLAQSGLPKEMLMPLIRETVDKLHHLPAFEAQTGPARRGDRETVQKHLKMLENQEGLQDIYQLFSEQILKKYHE